MYLQTNFDIKLLRGRPLYNVYQSGPYPAIKSEVVDSDEVRNTLLEKIKSLSTENASLRQKITEQAQKPAPEKKEKPPVVIAASAEQMPEAVYEDVEEKLVLPDGSVGEAFKHP